MQDHQNYIVERDKAGTRLDLFITDKESELSRSYAQKLISDGYVTIGGLRTKSSHKVCAGEKVRIQIPESQPNSGPRPEDIPLNIVFEDDEVIVVDKPAGMVVHPAAGVDSGTLVNAVLAHILPNLTARQAEKPDIFSIAPERPGIVHRIDKGTSGTIVVAKTARAYYSLVDQFREHSVQRKYVALICGGPKQDSGTIVAPIGRSRRDRKKMAVTSVNSKEAITKFSVIERYAKFSLIELKLETGRTHQIRVHLSHIGYPVVGDPTYGGRNRAIKSAVSQNVRIALQRLSRQALHAQLLGFIHPGTDQYVEFSAPIPEDIQNVIDALRSSEES
jgi:23S rRNA pseudouridine1911/1915/1917 synthase